MCISRCCLLLSSCILRTAWVPDSSQRLRPSLLADPDGLVSSQRQKTRHTRTWGRFWPQCCCKRCSDWLGLRHSVGIPGGFGSSPFPVCSLPFRKPCVFFAAQITRAFPACPARRAHTHKHGDCLSSLSSLSSKKKNTPHLATICYFFGCYYHVCLKFFPNRKVFNKKLGMTMEELWLTSYKDCSVFFTEADQSENRVQNNRRIRDHR